ncbi:MAG TPA: ferritin-like domain-containing protein [Solirubrobacteraceae bacterium]|nr:ferritin-like domain-containing protein [Solirubrobacteraceae bacterium]
MLGAAVAGAAVAIAAVTPARAAGSLPTQTGRPDPPAARLRRLIRVELLLLYCYEHVLPAPFVSGRARPVLAQQARHEQAHLRALTAELRRLAPAAPLPAGPATPAAADRALAHRNVQGRLGQLQGEKDALHLLLELERVVGGAYFVALTKLSSPRLIELAVSIMAAEAQHEALLGDLLYPGHPEQSVPYGLIQGVQ